MNLNEQVGGLIIDKKAQRDSRAEALLRHCCWTVTSVLVSFFCHSLYCFIVQLNCLPGRTHWDTGYDDERAWFQIPAYQSTRLWLRPQGPQGTHTQQKKKVMRPAADATHMLPRHTQTWRCIQTPLASGQIVHLMTALPRPHKPRGTHMCTLTPTHL